jgi:hypothetical protein
MKHIKTFESFRINEGILDNIKKGVKNIFTKKKDNPRPTEETPVVDETPKENNHKENVIKLYDVDVIDRSDLIKWFRKNIKDDKDDRFDDFLRRVNDKNGQNYELDISGLSSFDVIKLKSWLTLKGYSTKRPLWTDINSKWSINKLNREIQQTIENLGYEDLYKKALKWIEKCDYDVRGLWLYDYSSITISLEGLVAIDGSIIGVRLVDGKIKVGTSPSNLKVCNGPDELKSLVDGLKTTERERRDERDRLDLKKKEDFLKQQEDLEKTRKFRKPLKVSKEEWDKKLRHGTAPFTKREFEFLQKIKEKNSSKVCKIVLGKLGESHTFIINNIASSYYESRLELTKLNDEWYLIRWDSGVADGVDITNLIDGFNWTDDDVHEFYICDEWEEVLGYIERQWRVNWMKMMDETTEDTNAITQIPELDEEDYDGEEYEDEEDYDEDEEEEYEDEEDYDEDEEEEY